MDKDISSIKEDLKYEEAELPIRKIFWCLMGVFLLLSLLGFLGDKGILNDKKINTSDYTIEYSRYLRVEKQDKIEITLKNREKNCEIALNKDYLKSVKISLITPEPDETISFQNHIHYKFTSGEGGEVTFYIDPKKNGNVHLELNINGNKENLSQFIYF